MRADLYWVDNRWPGRLALAARPRGGDWLQDEMESWRSAGINVVLSLLTADEEMDLDLADEGQQSTAHGMEFLSFPIPDRMVPDSDAKMASMLERVESALASGKNVVVHCRQGIGRTGLVAACLLVSKGIPPDAAVDELSSVRGVPVPETPEQRRWIDHYATLSAIQ